MIRKLFVKDARLRPIWRVIIYAMAVVFVAALLFDIYDAVLGRQFEAQISFEDIVVGEMATAVAVVLVSIVMRRYIDRRSVASLGFSPRGSWLRLMALGILFGAGMQILANVALFASGCAHLIGFGSFANDLRLIAIAVPILLGAALLEEMSFRGYVLQNLWEEWGLVPALVISSVGFALLHLSNPHSREQFVLTFAGLVVFALWACMSLLWTKSLWLALGAHMAWNLFEGPVLGLPVSGLMMPAPTVIRQSVNGPQWLTGGSFGPEAGVISLVALIVGFLVLRTLYRKGAFADVVDTREEYAREQPQP